MTIKKETIDVSVVIPALNEARRLSVFLPVVLECARKSSLHYEVIVVNDGSRDETDAVVEFLRKECSFLKLIDLNPNRGKGFAVQQGFLQARGRYCLFLDADGSTQPDEIEKNLKYLENDCDIVIGSRVLKSKDVVRKKKVIRMLIGGVFNFLVRTFLFKNIKDTQCGFKIFKREVIEPVFSRMRIHRFGFDLEILYLAAKRGYRIKEVPVSWHHVAGSKVNLMRDSFQMFINILQIRYWHG